MSNKIELSGIFSDGYGINPKKLWKLKIGIYKLKNGKKIKGIYIKSVLSYMLSHTGSGNSCFPSINTISEDLEISKDIIINAINAAVEMDMISKEQMYPNDPLKHNNKYILNFMSNNTNYDVRHSRITCSTGTNFEVVTVEQNNNSINNNTINNNNNRVDKKAYADNVKMTEKEYKKLLDKYGDIQTNRLIQYLSDYKKEKGYKTKSDYLTITRWVVDAAKVKEIPEDEKIIISQPVPENNYLDQLKESASDEQNDIKF